ncbi:XRN 5'-3' exonuclease [Nitzschia inconspicua]|uniref:5'-3' exoribonuclease n=1 Tax=Nitzschia inconspicua TaxID=303405 RepID=A0A9K3LN30_9STRA|nr:XRN 5'-3' exonuclease [Nitzschia inconspicua]
MGVPAFFRWLTEKYPKILQDVLEERVKLVGDHGSVRIPFDSTRPNPSGIECDNLYIDMNGIIHPCSHPEHGPQPTTEDEMYENVCHYVDRLFRVMRPRKLLYLAIDGVAPRAKMNQQRARRFRSAQEARENLEVEENVRQELTKMGQKVPPLKKPWDSNVITPGTPFMLRLSEFIRFYIRKRISEDKAWQKIRVIFSDASIPGEGEHKIMAHIRLQRSQPGYSPNLVHVLHGLDADLIMLALATHEAHFYISREEVMFGRRSEEMKEQRQLESGFRDKQRQFDEEAGPMAMQLLENKQTPLCRVSIPILREYLANEFAPCITPGRIPFQPSMERMIDDFVFLCFFVGNDFIPHLPSLDIRDGALDFLFNVYKRVLPSLGDYITNHGGQVNLSHVDVILAELGAIEDYVFQMKHENERNENRRREEWKERKKQANGRNLDAPPPISTQPKPKVMGRAARILEKKNNEEQALKKLGEDKIVSSHMKAKENLKAALALKQSLGGIVIKKEEEYVAIKDEPDALKTEHSENGEDNDGTKFKEEFGKKRKMEDLENEEDMKIEDGGSGVGVVGEAEEEFEDDEDDEDEEIEPIKIELTEDISPEVAKTFKTRVQTEQQKKLDEYAKSVEDKVRLHEKGWKDRYYSDKCKADDVANHGGREHLFRSYIMGLCWVMKYYYEGVPSWKWYYPFHYAPFASDLKNIERFQNDVKKFEISTPFNPVEQLMAVLPSDSSHAIPEASRWLMTDVESPIIDFYPTEVPVDPNGKAMPWLWVVLLPFIDEDRLLSAMSPTMTKWSKSELLCNARGMDDGYVFIHASHPLAPKFEQILQDGKSARSLKKRLTDAASYGCPGFSGSVRPPLSNEIIPRGESLETPAVSPNAVLTSSDGLFTERIDSNDCFCVAFSEPPKLSHKSVLLPGAIVLPPTLNDEDKRIRRPRLNRGGGSIANMGVSNGQSFQSGNGSMNISSYERDLAQRTGRGHEMYQAGTRSWGSMEPTPKRRFQAQNPIQAYGYGRTPPLPPPSTQLPPWQQQQQQRQQYQQQQPPQNHYHDNARGYQQPYQHQYNRESYNNQQYKQQSHQPQSQGYFQQRNHRGNGGSYPPQGNPYRPQGPPRSGFDFRSHNQPPGPPGLGRSHQQHQQPQRSTTVNGNVMSSLKAQLKSTLKQNRDKR